MRFGLALELSNVDLLNTHLDLLDTDIPSILLVFIMFSRRLQDMSSRPANVCWVASSLPTQQKNKKII